MVPDQASIRKRIGKVNLTERRLLIDPVTQGKVAGTVERMLDDRIGGLTKYCKVFENIQGRTGESRLVEMIAPETWFDKMSELHAKHAHPGRATFFPIVSKYYSNCSRDVVSIFIECCTIKQQLMAKKARATRRIILSRRVFGRVQADLVEMAGIPQNSEYRYILHLRCHFSRFSWTWPQRTRSMEETVSNIRFFCKVIIPPSILQTDNGGEFGRELDALTSEFPQIRKIIHGRPRHPQSQGSVERANCILKNKLNLLLSGKGEEGRRNWHLFLADATASMNESVCRATGKTPREIVFSQRSLTSADETLMDESQLQYRELPDDGENTAPDFNRMATEELQENHTPIQGEEYGGTEEPSNQTTEEDNTEEGRTNISHLENPSHESRKFESNSHSEGEDSRSHSIPEGPPEAEGNTEYRNNRKRTMQNESEEALQPRRRIKSSALSPSGSIMQKALTSQERYNTRRAAREKARADIFEVGDVVGVRVPSEDRTKLDPSILWGKVVFVQISGDDSTRSYRIMTGKCLLRGFFTNAHLFKTTADFEELHEIETPHASRLLSPRCGNTIRSAVMLQTGCSNELKKECRCRKGRCTDTRCRCKKNGRLCTSSCYCQKLRNCNNDEPNLEFDPEAPTPPPVPEE